MPQPEADLSVTHGSVISPDGTSLGFLRLGSGSPLVVCHRAFTMAQDWLPFAARMAASHTVYLYERRGRGISPNVSDDFAIDAEVEDLGAIVASIGLDAAILGHSFGGACALAYAARGSIATPGGLTYWYDKRHLFRMGGEHRHYHGGAHALIVEWRGARLCPLVCYDLRFPVWSRRRPELEYDVVIYSANWPAARRFAWTALLRARAIENQAYCIGVNRVGDDSVVLDFSGQPLLELNQHAQVITVPLDLPGLRAWRDKFPAHLDADAFTLES